MVKIMESYGSKKLDFIRWTVKHLDNPKELKQHSLGITWAFSGNLFSCFFTPDNGLKNSLCVSKAKETHSYQMEEPGSRRSVSPRLLAALIPSEHDDPGETSNGNIK